MWRSRICLFPKPPGMRFLIQNCTCGWLSWFSWFSRLEATLNSLELSCGVIARHDTIEQSQHDRSWSQTVTGDWHNIAESEKALIGQTGWLTFCREQMATAIGRVIRHGSAVFILIKRNVREEKYKLAQVIIVEREAPSQISVSECSCAVH